MLCFSNWLNIDIVVTWTAMLLNRDGWLPAWTAGITRCSHHTSNRSWLQRSDSHWPAVLDVWLVDMLQDEVSSTLSVAESSLVTDMYTSSSESSAKYTLLQSVCTELRCWRNHSMYKPDNIFNKIKFDKHETENKLFTTAHDGLQWCPCKVEFDS